MSRVEIDIKNCDGSEYVFFPACAYNGNRFNVLKKNYIYKINIGKYNLFERNYITQINQELNLEKIKDASLLFIGTHDYRNFCANNDKDDDYIRTIYSIDVTKKDDYIILSFIGSGFKRYMVRMIVGTIIEYSKDRINLDYIYERLDINEFNTTQYNAAPEGLYLNEVYYERDDLLES